MRAIERTHFIVATAARLNARGQAKTLSKFGGRNLVASLAPKVRERTVIFVKFAFLFCALVVMPRPKHRLAGVCMRPN